MSRNRRLIKAIRKNYKRFSKKFLYSINKQIIWLLRAFFGSKKRRGAVNAGFVLPTVVMVGLVVILLTTAILFRSFDRAKNASNVRVNEAVLNAATPAIDRARAKIDALFDEPTVRTQGTPTDSVLYDNLKKDKYRLGDETRLKLAYEFNGISGIQTSNIVENDETLKSAWKFAVDTDNNGLKDSYTLYGIYFRVATTSRQKNPLDPRTPPMDNNSTNQNCLSAAGFSSIVGDSNWYKLKSGNLGKSFFVYTVNVPITKAEYDGLTSKNGYEQYKGNQGFVGLEFQQDRSLIPLQHNAVWYENDLEITPGVDLTVNGRIHTNSNLLVGGDPNAKDPVTNQKPVITLRQVSSKFSCFYNQENGEISVGGNVGTGNVASTSNQQPVTVDLFQGYGKSVNTTTIDGSNKSATTSQGGSEIGFNDAAYNQRIAQMKTDAINLCTACKTATNGSNLKTAVNASSYPNDVKNNVTNQVNDTDDATTAQNILAQEIEIYLRNRTRRVPFSEVSDATGVGATSGYTTITASLDPQQTWREPLDSSNNLNSTSVAIDTSQLQATYPIKQKQDGVQSLVGDRVFVGNNLPALWQQTDTSGNVTYVGSDANQLIYKNSNPVNWTAPTGSNAQQRWRNTQIQAIADLGISDRNGFWEQKAVENPTNVSDSAGGVRIVTGAGIYVDGSGSSIATGPFYGRSDKSFLLDPPNPPSLLDPPNPPSPFDATKDITVWPDTMPMSSSDSTKNPKGDLLMRATAVYHYKVKSGTDQTPIACVSSYYDPTNADTAKNKNGFPWNASTNGKSNNGIVYDFPGRTTFATYKAQLQRQVKLVFPNGRRVNQPLKDALDHIGAGTTVPSTGLQLADYSAIDTALCAISILNNETGYNTSVTDQPPHGAIKEASFLDGREAKQISTSSSVNPSDVSTANDLDLEQRQPLEIRVTDIDLGQLAKTSISSASEYLLPYSGIIYASRDDGLPDATDTTSQSQLLSPTDFKLDPTRRPNGIRLINGGTLARDPSTNKNSYNQKEKGLILVTNLPAYIKGNFNLHRTSTTSTTEIEEFSQPAYNASDSDQNSKSNTFYNRSTPNTYFACRKGRTGCSNNDGENDYWRSATIIADSITLLSGDSPSQGFIDGFRNQGDYDLNNNTGIVVVSKKYDQYNSTFVNSLEPITQKRLKNGFWENNFVTNVNWWQTSGSDKNYPTKTTLGSYTLNSVTPIQRRVDGYPMYVMEICRQDLISQCQPGDWKVGFDVNGNGNLEDTVSFDVNGDTLVDNNDKEKDIKTYQLGQAILAANGSNPNPDSNNDKVLTSSELSWTTAFPTSSDKSIRERLGSGDTSDKLALVLTDQRYPRRVAFARDNSNQLVTTSPGIYKPMGVGCSLDTTGTVYANNGCKYGTPSTENINFGQATGSKSVLWFRTTDNSSPSDINHAAYDKNQSLFYQSPTDNLGQPLLVPVLQIHDAASMAPPNLRKDNVLQGEFRQKWLNAADADTIFNATFVVGNSPSRKEEASAGLQNFVRFLEDWLGKTGKISGSFIQLKRSAYATGSISPIFSANTGVSTTGGNPIITADKNNNLSLFKYEYDTYPTYNASGLSPFYSAPTRKWGFDVGLLSEPPDMFSQRFTTPPTGRPNEFFREVSQDDNWVKTLLCAGQASDLKGLTGATYSNAAPTAYRPTDCPTIPADS